MQYKIIVEKPAQKFISKLPKPEKERVLRAISLLPSGDIKQMQGHSGFYCLRVGTYRVIYTIDNGQLVICVIDAGNRGDIYKKY